MKKTVLVTGASGLLGSHVVKALLAEGCNVIVSILPVEKDTYEPADGVRVIVNDDIFDGLVHGVDSVVNCAFARSNNLEQLASAFEFTKKLIEGFEKCEVGGVINISSQGVYKRLPVGELSIETSPIDPIDTYSVSKFACEKMFELSGIGHCTNVRLASINMKQRFLNKFVECVKSSVPIMLNAPGQYASLLDVNDAAKALAKLSILSPESWKSVYNLGLGKQYSLLEYAEMVRKIGRSYGYEAEIVVEDNGASSTAGMSIERIVADTGWHPEITPEMMIDEMFKQN